jgi:hypothetical protein
MAHFCTQCGSRNEEAAALFCTNCGHRFKLAAPSPLTEESVTARPQHSALPSRRLWLIGAAVLGVLLIAGGGIAYYLRPPAATPEVYTTAIDQYLAAHREAMQDKVCLGNFPYNKNPVVTNTADSQTNHWLGLLVQAGIYDKPEPLLDGFWPKLRYQMTARGLAAVKGSRLCLAQGLKVASIDHIATPETVAGVLAGKARFHTRLDGKADWVTADIAQQLPGADGEQTLLMMVQERQWQVMDELHQQQLRQQFGAEAASSDGDAGMFAWLGRLTGPSEPSEDEIWTALVQRLPMLNRDASHFAKHGCAAFAEGAGFHCTIQLGGREERVRMRKQGDAWQAQPE